MATRPAFPPRHPPEPSVALKYSASGHLRVRSMHFYAADYLFPVPVPPSPVSPPPPSLEPLSGRIMDSRPTRLPRSLSPSRIRNKSGPFSARLLSAIVLFASLYRANRFFCHDRRTFCGTSRSSANAANETHER